MSGVQWEDRQPGLISSQPPQSKYKIVGAKVVPADVTFISLFPFYLQTEILFSQEFDWGRFPRFTWGSKAAEPHPSQDLKRKDVGVPCSSVPDQKTGIF